MWLRFLPFVTAFLAGNLAFTILAQESPSYSMDRVTAISMGTTVSSSNYETTVVMGQDSPAGAASYCNSGFIGSFGFWSVLGDLPVPIRLEVEKDSGDPSVVQLSWSGADDLFQVFRSLTPDNVLDPINLDGETAACAAADSQAGTADLIFYKIIAGSTD
jgi:hypothetical protein